MRSYIVILFFVFSSSSSFSQTCNPPGRLMQTTRYDFQAYSSVSTIDRIAVDYINGIHIAMTAGDGNMIRNTWYNFRDENGEWLHEVAVEVSSYPQNYNPGIVCDANGIPFISYYYVNGPEIAIDYFRGFGVFQLFSVPNQIPDFHDAFSIVGAISFDGIYHAVIEEYLAVSDYCYIAYTKTSDRGLTWSQIEIIDSATVHSSVITSATTGALAIAYLKFAGESVITAYENDVYFVVSEDGQEWDFSNIINITDYNSDNEDNYAVSGLDAVFDFSGNLHLIWVTRNINEYGQFVDSTATLWHYSNGGEEIYEIYTTIDDDLNCSTRYWPPYFLSEPAIARPSLSVDSTGLLSVTFESYNDADKSALDTCNGDLYICASYNEGYDWTAPINITRTYTPNCTYGNCKSEVFPSAAEIISDSLYITYVMDNTGIGQSIDSIYFLSVAINQISDLDKDALIPDNYFCLTNYPNPFNAQTTINYSLSESSDISIEIYDILARRVEVIDEGEKSAGEHQRTWNAEGQPSGVYFYRIQAGDYSETMKMVLLR